MDNLDIKEVTKYEVLGKTFSSKDDAKKHIKKVTICDILEEKIYLRGIDTMEELIDILNEEGFTICKMEQN